MHELSIAISMIDQIAEESASRGGLEVEVVHMRLGIFAGIDKDALLFSYSLACEGTPLQGSQLIIETVPLLVYCPACNQERTPPSIYQICCPVCFTPTPEILTGREMEVAYLEVAA
jgi:hydrogenase nickel incorporation protein HypA/HybF